jgi:hypothetical protein
MTDGNAADLIIFSGSQGLDTIIALTGDFSFTDAIMFKAAIFHGISFIL